MSFHSIYPNGVLPDLTVEVDVTNDPTSATRTWTDITTDVRQLSYSRSGRSMERNRTETGTATLLCNDRSEAVSGLGLKRAQWLRVQAQWSSTMYARWQGIIETVSRRWPSAGNDATVAIQAADILKILRLYDLAGETFSAQRNDQRIGALAALAGITTGTLDTDTDDADANSTPQTEGSDALSYALQVEESENGLLVAQPDGTLDFQGRHYRLVNSSTSSATFGESAGEIPYRDSAEYDDDDALIANVAAVTPFGATAPVVVTDTSSTATYWTRRLNRTLLTSSTSVATDAAHYLVNRYKDPSPRLPAIDVDLLAASLKDSSLVAKLLAANNSDRFTWNRAAPTAISDDVYVEQVSESIVPGTSWSMSFQLSPAADTAAWVLGDAMNSLLGESTVLIY